MGVVLPSPVTPRLGTLLSPAGVHSKLAVGAGLSMTVLKRVQPAVKGLLDGFLDRKPAEEVFSDMPSLDVTNVQF